LLPIWLALPDRIELSTSSYQGPAGVGLSASEAFVFEPGAIRYPAISHILLSIKSRLRSGAKRCNMPASSTRATRSGNPGHSVADF
jgi:hypothetical protein